MRLWLDADAAPRDVKDVCLRASDRLKLDTVLVANQRGVIPGAVLAVRPVGVLKMQDEAGGDEKIIAVPIPKLTRRYEKVHNYTDLPEITVRQVQHFFEHYKDLETSKWVKVVGWGDAAEARQYIVASMERAKAHKAKG